MGKKPFCNCLAHSSRPSPGLQPATRMVAGFRSPPFGPPLHQHAPFRHRGASVSGSLRPSATVAAWQPGPAAPFRGRHRFRQASSPPVQARCFAATFPPSSPPAFIHARRTPLVQRFLHDPSASTGPASSVAASDHASAIRNSKNLQKEAATATEKSVTVAARSAPPTVSPASPPSHQR